MQKQRYEIRGNILGRKKASDNELSSPFSRKSTPASKNSKDKTRCNYKLSETVQISSSKLETKKRSNYRSKFPHQMRRKYKKNKRKREKKNIYKKKIEFSIAICFFGKQRTCHQVVDNHVSKGCAFAVH